MAFHRSGRLWTVSRDMIHALLWLICVSSAVGSSGQESEEFDQQPRQQSSGLLHLDRCAGGTGLRVERKCHPLCFCQDTQAAGCGYWAATEGGKQSWKSCNPDSTAPSQARRQRTQSHRSVFHSYDNYVIAAERDLMKPQGFVCLQKTSRPHCKDPFFPETYPPLLCFAQV